MGRRRDTPTGSTCSGAPRRSGWRTRCSFPCSAIRSTRCSSAASRDINYRRFFDVNELIALKVEDAAVFDATHRTVLQFVADGLVDGLRIDHIDGLLEPRRYLERLREAVDARRRG